MSSILDALKKLEEETVSGSGLKPCIRNKPGPGNAIRFFLADRLLIIVITGLICLGAAGFWLYFKNSGTAATMMVKQQEPSRQQDRRSTETPEKPVPVKTAAAAPAQEGQPDKQTGDNSGGQSGAKQQSGTDQIRTEKEAPTEPGSDRSQEQAQSMEPGRNDPAAGSPGSSSERMDSRAAKLDELPEDAGLTLQAISWSEEPKRRVAVVNNKICKEGEKVDGFVIRRINPEDVRVDDGSTEWMLRFERR